MDLKLFINIKKNGGMHTAHNLAYELIDTELNVCIDSDDRLSDNAVEKMLDFGRKWVFSVCRICWLG